MRGVLSHNKIVMLNARTEATNNDHHVAPSVLVNRADLLSYYVGARIYLRTDYFSMLSTCSFALIYLHGFLPTHFYIALFLVNLLAYVVVTILNAYEYAEHMEWNAFIQGGFVGLLILLPVINAFWFRWVSYRWLKKCGLENGFLNQVMGRDVKSRWSMLCQAFGLELQPLTLIRHRSDFRSGFRAEIEN